MYGFIIVRLWLNNHPVFCAFHSSYHICTYGCHQFLHVLVLLRLCESGAVDSNWNGWHYFCRAATIQHRLWLLLPGVFHTSSNSSCKYKHWWWCVCIIIYWLAVPGYYLPILGVWQISRAAKVSIEHSIVIMTCIYRYIIYSIAI